MSRKSYDIPKDDSKTVKFKEPLNSFCTARIDEPMTATASMTYLSTYCIIDSATDTHVINTSQLRHFEQTREARDTDYINAGGSKFKVEAWGNIVLSVQTKKSEFETIKLTNVAYIPEFLASIISLDILASKGTY